MKTANELHKIATKSKVEYDIKDYTETILAIEKVLIAEAEKGHFKHEIVINGNKHLPATEKMIIQELKANGYKVKLKGYTPILEYTYYIVSWKKPKRKER